MNNINYTVVIPVHGAEGETIGRVRKAIDGTWSAFQGSDFLVAEGCETFEEAQDALYQYAGSWQVVAKGAAGEMFVFREASHLNVLECPVVELTLRGEALQYVGESLVNVIRPVSGTEPFTYYGETAQTLYTWLWQS